MTVQEFKELLEDVAERIETDAHQIAQLTAENERLLRVVEQAIELGSIDFMGHDLYSATGHACKTEHPDLFAQLKGVE
jgi:hypothetical protein